jgi:uncharacterized protein
MKVELRRIPDDGLVTSVDLDVRGFEQLLADPKREIRGADGGLDAELVLQRVQETVLVRGRACAHLSVACVRCMAPQVLRVVVAVDAVLTPVPEWGESEGEEDVELEQDELNVSYYEGDEIDLGPLLREAILLEMPQYPSCGIEPREECEHYQDNIGARARKMEESASVDLRWEKLGALKSLMVKNGTS